MMIMIGKKNSRLKYLRISNSNRLRKLVRSRSSLLSPSLRRNSSKSLHLMLSRILINTITRINKIKSKMIIWLILMNLNKMIIIFNNSNKLILIKNKSPNNNNKIYLMNFLISNRFNPSTNNNNNSNNNNSSSNSNNFNSNSFNSNSNINLISNNNKFSNSNNRNNK